MSSEPIFNDGQGTVTVMNITTGDQPFSLQKGCDFVVSRYLQIKPNEIYWLELKNGTTKKIFQNKTQLEKFSNVESNEITYKFQNLTSCLLYTSPSPRDKRQSRMPSSA